MDSSHRPVGRTTEGARWRRILTSATAGAVGVLGLVGVPSTASAVSATPVTGWSVAWKSYGFTSGADVMDVDDDVSPARDDLVSGSPQRTAPTALYGSDGTNAFLRMRLAADSTVAAKGGLFGDIFLVELADADGTAQGIIGVDGNSETADFVQVTNADGTGVTHVYDYPVDGFRMVAVGDGSGQYFLDFQVPFTAIHAVWPQFDLDGSTPVKLFYRTATANALGNINKDYMTGSKIDFTDLRAVRFVPPHHTVTFDPNTGTHDGSTTTVVDEGGKVAQPSNPTWAGHTFAGWWTAASGGTQWAFQTSTVPGDTTLYAHWTVNSYTVTFATDGGSTAPADQSVDFGGTITKPADDPTRTGYTFVGWYDESTGRAWDFDTDTVDADTTLVAHWSRDPVTVTFDTDGGSTNPADATIKPGDLLTAPADPTKTGYTFVGWYDESTGQAWHFDTDTVTDTTHLVAHWTINSYTITFTTDGGTAPADQTVDFGNPVSQPADPTKTGYTFTGWYDGDNPWDFSQPVTSAVTLVAHWSRDPVTITFDTDGGSTNPADATIKPGDLLTAPADPTKTGYTFTGWYDESTDPATKWDFTTDTVTDTTHLVAHWEVNSYTVTFTTDGGTAPADQSVDFGGTITKPADDPTRTGYTFVGWYDESTGRAWDFDTDTVDADTTLVAHWSRDPVTITFDTDGGSTNPADATIKPGDLLTAPADPTKTGYTFTGWYDESTTPATKWDFTTDTVTGATHLVAHWQINSYTVTFTTDGGTAPADQTVDFGTPVSQPADPTRTGYTFTGWYDESTTPATKWDFLTDTVTGATHLVAHWQVNSYTVTFTTDGDSAPADQTVDFGTPVSQPADPTRTGYTFIGWYDESTTPATKWDFLTDTVTATTHLVAHWEINSYAVTFTSTGDSTAPDDQLVDFGSPVSQPADPTKTGYTFTGWYDGDTPWDFSQPVTSALTLTAHWTPIAVNTCTLTFDADGGSAVDPIQVPCGQGATAPTAPTKHGYTFTGWATGDGTAYAFGSPVDRDLALVARWTEADSDGDGLTDLQEEAIGTDPNDPDTDHDGLSDGDEVAGGLTGYTHCLTSPLQADTDHDRLSDGREVHGIRMRVRVVVGRKNAHRIGIVRTDPCRADTDHDRLSDRREVRGVKVAKRHATYRTSPVLKDTDGDGLRDRREETGAANKKFHHAPSNPLNWDTDHGGVGDGAEVRAGSNPVDIHSSPVRPGS